MSATQVSQDIDLPKKASKRQGVKKQGGAEKRHRKRKTSFASYIFKVLKQVHPNTSITRRSMNIMDTYIGDQLEALVREASVLAQSNKRQTISGREIQSAVRLVLPGELAKHAVSEGTKAVTIYNAYGASE